MDTNYNFEFKIKESLKTHFKKIFKSLEKITDNVIMSIDITNNHSKLTIKSEGNYKNMLFNLELDTSSFDYFRCFENISVSIDVESICKYFDIMQKSDPIIIYMQKSDTDNIYLKKTTFDYSDMLCIKYDSTSKNTSYIRQKLVDYKISLKTFKSLDIPKKIEFLKTFNLGAHEFNMICQNLKPYKFIEILYTDNDILFFNNTNDTNIKLVYPDRSNVNSVGAFEPMRITNFSECYQLSTNNNLEINFMNCLMMIKTDISLGKLYVFIAGAQILKS